MSVFLQSVLAVFAAVGFYTVLHTVYEIVSARRFAIREGGRTVGSGVVTAINA